jgi:RNA polymerase II subunit A small phosphatase-like protein
MGEIEIGLIADHLYKCGKIETNPMIKLVIFDLDETLIHSSNEWLGRTYDFIAGSKMVYVRPQAVELILKLKDKYKIAIWTASYGKYTQEILANLFGADYRFEFIWDREHCSKKSKPDGFEYFEKDLFKIQALGWKTQEFVVIDDFPENLINIDSNIIKIKPFYGSCSDVELTNLFDLL